MIDDRSQANTGAMLPAGAVLLNGHATTLTGPVWLAPAAHTWLAGHSELHNQAHNGRRSTRLVSVGKTQFGHAATHHTATEVAPEASLKRPAQEAHRAHERSSAAAAAAAARAQVNNRQQSKTAHPRRRQRVSRHPAHRRSPARTGARSAPCCRRDSGNLNKATQCSMTTKVLRLRGQNACTFGGVTRGALSAARRGNRPRSTVVACAQDEHGATLSRGRQLADLAGTGRCNWLSFAQKSPTVLCTSN